MRTYTEQYVYDAVGNIEQLIHQAANGNWTRPYAYNEPSLIEPGKKSNRLSSTSVSGVVEAYTYDANGNTTGMPHLTLMQWDFKDQLSATSRQAVNNSPSPSTTPETTYYVYDAGGQRVRKVTERQNGLRKSDRVYLGGFEVYREFDAGGSSVSLQRETLHVMDDKRRIALVDQRTQGDDGSPDELTRYQIGNHLGSTSVELDDNSAVISYEEYYPYGSTSYQAVNQGIRGATKRYRYIGKERDEENGFTYHGARYYAPWLGRWTAADPIGIKDGVNLYAYVRGRVPNAYDLDGHQSLFTYGMQVAGQTRPTTPADRVAVAQAAGRVVGRDYGEALAYADKAFQFFHVKELEKRGPKGAEAAEKLRAAVRADLEGVLSRLPKYEEAPLQQAAMAEFTRQAGVSYIRAKLELTARDLALDLLAMGAVAAVEKLSFKAIQLAARQLVGPLLRAATIEAAEAARASGRTVGPVVAGVTDLRTGRSFFALNAQGLPTNLHPILEARIKALQASPQHFSIVGSHAEVHALNEALWARTNAGEAAGSIAAEGRASIFAGGVVGRQRVGGEANHRPARGEQPSRRRAELQRRQADGAGAVRRDACKCRGRHANGEGEKRRDRAPQQAVQARDQRRAATHGAECGSADR
jgi:RHS repeat-associated protein